MHVSHCSFLGVSNNSSSRGTVRRQDHDIKNLVLELLCPDKPQTRFTIVASEVLSSIRQLVMNTTLQHFVDDVVESSNFWSLRDRLEGFNGESQMIFVFLR